MVAVQATKEEISLCLGLTPIQRRDRLMTTLVPPIGAISHAVNLPAPAVVRTTRYIRITLRHPTDHDAISALSTHERRERLLVGLTE